MESPPQGDRLHKWCSAIVKVGKDLGELVLLNAVFAAAARATGNVFVIVVWAITSAALTFYGVPLAETVRSAFFPKSSAPAAPIVGVAVTAALAFLTFLATIALLRSGLPKS